jgi:DNA-binding MarR family transcriptional regulator
MSGFDTESLRTVAAECPGFQARVTARAVTRHYNAWFKPLGLTAEQFSLLVGIAKAEGDILVDLAASSGVDATTLSRNVQTLEVKGLVHAEGGRGRAGKRLQLTATGRKMLSEALPLWKAAKAELSGQMGDDRLQSSILAMAELGKAAGACL